jgi:tetratricopeptide (TPR) repeat protein
MDKTDNDAEQQQDSTQDYIVLQQLGDCYISVGNYDQAQKCYEKAAGLEPDEPAPYVGLGVCQLASAGSLDEAEIAFRVARRLDAGCSKAYAGLAMVAQQRGDYKKAFDMYLKCLELDIDNLVALLGLFQTSCQMGSFGMVTHYLELYLNMHPADTSVMFPLATLYMKDNKLERAQKMLLELLDLDPDNNDAAGLLEEVEHCLAQERQKGVKTE